ncbi:MAG TPA: DUF4197 domain-containing protein, partial [Ginsengibacter sp.]|nr:DUF4197 domain-containing protein [Ginsengibacter sp.]
MKRIVFSLLISGFFLSSCEITGNLPINTGNSGGLSTSEIASGLKEALRVGTDTATKSLSAVNGFFSNAAVKVLMPPEAQKVEKTLRDIGMGKLVDNAILSMNRAAEDASKFAGNIFWEAIRQMTIQDAIGILKGGD